MGRSLVAVNTAPDSENEMHGDAAQRYGFAGGLVPGVDVLGYLAHEAVERWGTGWLSGGRLDGRLIAPCYDGETLQVDTTDKSGVVTSRVVGSDGVERAVATLDVVASPADAPAVDPVSFAVLEPCDPAERPPAARELLEPGTPLATQRVRFDADRAQSYLGEISESHTAFLLDGLAHPGWLLRFANWALSRTVRLGPWIHVSSDAWFLDAVRHGEELEVRAVVTDRFERKGHELVALRVVYLVDERLVGLVDHRAIWQPRPAI
jgi:acyl dehydratase